MIFPIQHAMETYSEIIPLWSREGENYVGLQKHTLEFVVLIYGFPNVTTAIQREYHIATSRNLSPEEELLPLHGGRKQRRWRRIRGHFPVPARWRRRKVI